MSYCDDTDSLVLGTEAGGLEVRVIPGEARTFLLVLTEVDGPPVAWPAAPELVFASFTLTATLGPSAAPLAVVADALATWTLSAELSATLSEYDPVRLRVSGETWWIGVVRCQS